MRGSIIITAGKVPQAWQEVYDRGRVEAGYTRIKDIKATLQLEEDCLIGYAYDARHPDIDTAMDATYHFWYARGKIDELRKMIL